MKPILFKSAMLTAVVIPLAVWLSSFGELQPSSSDSSDLICPDGPVPECPFPDGEKDNVYFSLFPVFFPHPNDCEWFFHCLNGFPDCKKCPAGLHWNVELETCDYPYRAGCSDVW